MINCESCKYANKFTNGLILCKRTKTSIRVNATDSCKYAKEEKIMNDINEMPPKCQYCPYWEVCKFPWVCPDIEDKKSDLQPTYNQLTTDAISRHGVSAWLDNMGYSKLADVIMDEKRFPPVQPETAERTMGTAQNVSDEDLISRKAAMNRIDEALARVFVDSRGCGEYALRKLPSVKPERERGHWVGIDDEPCETWECDRCGCIQECFDGEQPNYCPQCGADMRR